MPSKTAIDRAKEDARDGKSPSTQAGEFVREEIEHVREGVHGARSPKQAIAIGLSKARRAGVKLPPPLNGKAEKKQTAPVSKKRSKASLEALNKEGHSAASHSALSRHAHEVAERR